MNIHLQKFSATIFKSFAAIFSVCLTFSVATSCSSAKEKSVTAVNVSSQLHTNSANHKSATDAKLFGVNLIKNGGAETGNGDNWTNSDELKTIIYGDFGGGPNPDSPGPQSRGDKYFYARTSTEQPTAVFAQKIEVGEIAEIIDKGKVDYNFGGWFGVANGSSSAGRLKVSFLDKDDKEISADATEEITEAERPADEVLVEKNRSRNLPAGTRKIAITLEFKVFPGHDEKQDNLAFADNLSLILTKKGDN